MTTPTPRASIPLVAGSLGAPAMIAVAQGRAPPASDPMLDRLQRLADQGFCEVEDYVGWNVVEPARGRIDFRMHEEHRRAAERAGLRYRVYPWLHALPRWVLAERAFDPFMCVEHALPTGAPSIFQPSTFEAMERFLDLIRTALGADLHGVTAAIPCEYGEAGFPTGMAAWVFAHAAPFGHVHEGFWCGDPAARAAWAEHAEVAGRGGVDGAAFPLAAGAEPEATADRATVARATAFYRGALTRFTARLLDLANALFPGARLAIKLGFAGEKACYGHDVTALIAAARARDAEVWSTHGTLPVVFHKRIQTPCRVLGARYCTEGLTERTRGDVLDRLFEDAADGARVFFEFHDTWRAHEDAFAAHLPLLRGEEPEVDVVLLFNSSQQDERPGQSLPPGLLALAEPLRDLTDFEVFDEDLLQAPSALLHRGVVVLPDPGPMRSATIDVLRAFARSGGLVVVPSRPVVSALETGEPLFRATASEPAETGELARFSGMPLDALELAFGRGDEWHWFGDVHGPDRAAHFFPDAAAARDEDATCRWLGGACGLRLPADDTSDWDGVFEVFADPRAEPGRWTLGHRGRTLVRGVPVGASVLRVRIDRGAIGDHGHVEFRFEGPTFRPRERDGGPDRRDLGLVARRVRLRRAPGHAGDDATLPLASADQVRSLDPERWIESPRSIEPLRLGTPLDASVNVTAVRERAFVREGRGGFLVAPPRDLTVLAALTVSASNDRAAFVDGATTPPRVAGRHDGLRVAASSDRWLLYNRGIAPARRILPGRDGGSRTVQIPPGMIVALPR